MEHPEILAAFAVSRRTIVLCVLRGTTIEHIRRLTLHPNLERAERSITEFVNRAVEEFQLSTVALETPREVSDRLGRLHQHITKTLRTMSVSIYEVPRNILETQFWLMPYRTRQQLREAVLGLWPSLAEKKLTRFACDAAALGLYAQAQRLIAAHLQSA